MPPHDDRRSEHEWQKDLILGMSELKAQSNRMADELKSLRQNDSDIKEGVENLRRDINGRFKKLEHTVFGNEEVDKIGLVEKVRNLSIVTDIVIGDDTKGLISLPERVRGLESGWAKLTTVSVLACSLLIEIGKLAWGYFYATIQSGGKPHP